MELIKKPTGQDVLGNVSVRLIQEHEKPKWNALIEKEHYLHNARLVVEQLRYVAEFKGEWLVLLSWSEVAYHSPVGRLDGYAALYALSAGYSSGDRRASCNWLPGMGYDGGAILELEALRRFLWWPRLCL